MTKTVLSSSLESVADVTQKIITDPHSASDAMEVAAAAAKEIEREQGKLILARLLHYEKVEEAVGKLNTVTQGYVRQIVMGVASFLVYKAAFLDINKPPDINQGTYTHPRLQAISQTEYYKNWLFRGSSCETSFMLDMVELYLFPALAIVLRDERNQKFLEVFDSYFRYESGPPLAQHERKGLLERLLIENVHAARELVIGGLQAYEAALHLSDDQYERVPNWLDREVGALGIPARMNTSGIMDLVFDFQGKKKLTPLTRIRPGAISVASDGTLMWTDSRLNTWLNRPQHCVAYSAYTPPSSDDKQRFRELNGGRDAMAALDILLHLAVEVGSYNILTLEARAEMASPHTRRPSLPDGVTLELDLPSISPAGPPIIGYSTVHRDSLGY
jgi:hypothetical protein